MGVTVGIVQPPAVLDLDESLRRAAEGIRETAAADAGLAVFAETWLTGYPAWVFVLAGSDDATARHWHARLLRESPVLGAPEDLDDDIAPLR